MTNIQFQNLEQENNRIKIKQSKNTTFSNWLSGGSFYRNGPAVFDKNGVKLSHWIDGLAMIHRFTFANQDIYYTNRLLRTSHYKKLYVEKKYPYPLFGSYYRQKLNVITKTIVDKLTFSGNRYFPNANVGVAIINKQLVVLGDYPRPIVLDYDNLTVEKLLRFTDSLPVERCMEPGHPHFDAKTGDIFGLIIKFGLQGQYIFYRVAKDSLERKKICSLKTKYPSYIHSFAVTENFIILFEYPFLIDIHKFLFSHKSFINNFEWKETENTRITIFEKESGKLVKTTQTTPCFSFHHVNAFESADRFGC